MLQKPLAWMLRTWLFFVCFLIKTWCHFQVRNSTEGFFLSGKGVFTLPLTAESYITLCRLTLADVTFAAMASLQLSFLDTLALTNVFGPLQNYC